MNVVLTGFMGAGKTAVGRILAEKLKKEFFDTDEMVERRAGKTISEIFSDSGEPAFREMEREVVLAVAAFDGKVISTGGGAVLRRESVEALRKNGIIINLDSRPEKIFERLKNSDDRPLLEQTDAQTKIRKLLAERERFYADCDFRVDTSIMSPDDIAERIIAYLEARGYK
ncbi:MAG: shikimate kinase [Endomicrobiia bacterium]|nr:shikimate kinase [Endomicrobiia bacterium]